MYKVATTDQILEMIDYAAVHELNRQPTDDLVQNLDPTGLHILSLVMIHDHANGVEVTPHARCRVMAKVRETSEPVEFMLDTNMQLLEACVDAEAARELISTLRRRVAE